MSSVPQTTTEVQTASQPEKPNGAPAPAAGLLDATIEQTMSLDRERLKVEEEKFQFQHRRAVTYMQSGLFRSDRRKDSEVEAIAQAMVKIELGQSLGFTPPESLAGIQIINGQTAIAAALRAARIQQRGWTWDLEWIGGEINCQGCRLWLYHRGERKWQPIDPDRSEESINRLAQQRRIRYDDAGEPAEEQVSVSFLKAHAEILMTKLWEDGPQGRTSRSVSVLEKDNWKMSPRNMYFARAVTNAQRWYDPAAVSSNIVSAEEALDMVEPEPPQPPPAESRPSRPAQPRSGKNPPKEKPAAPGDQDHGNANRVDQAAPAGEQVDPAADLEATLKTFTGFKPIVSAISGIKTKLGERMYYDVLERFGMKHANEFKTVENARKVYTALWKELHAGQDAFDQHMAAEEAAGR